MKLLILLVSAFLGAYVGWIAILRKEKLKRFPGPWLASFTDLWGMWHVYMTKEKEPLRDLHAKYGSIVRTGPNKLIFESNNAARDILNVTRNLQKSSFYPVHAATKDGYPIVNLFGSQDVKYHDTIRRLITRPFSVTSSTSHEEAVDRVIDIFIEQIRRRYADKQGSEGVFELGRWFQNFALDTFGEINFSTAFGYLEADQDIFDFIKDNHFFMIYCRYVCQAPSLDHFLLKNPLLMWLNRKGIIGTFVPAGARFAFEKQRVRVKELEENAEPRNDLLDMLLEIKKANPDIFNDEEVFKTLVGVIFAGADTTAMFVAATFRYIMRDPLVYSKLQNEIDQPTDFSYTRSADCPYLDAVIKEVARMFPVVRFSYERLTPSDGMMIDGQKIPGDVNVSVNPWVAGHDPSVWGEDHESFNPDRWMVDSETYRIMSNKLLLFGLGKYQCLGLHMAYTAAYKVIPRLLKIFNFELANPKDDWKWGEGQFLFIKNLNVRVSSR